MLEVTQEVIGSQSDLNLLTVLPLEGGLCPVQNLGSEETPNERVGKGSSTSLWARTRRP